MNNFFNYILNLFKKSNPKLKLDKLFLNYNEDEFDLLENYLIDLKYLHDIDFDTYRKLNEVNEYHIYFPNDRKSYDVYSIKDILKLISFHYSYQINKDIFKQLNT